MKPLCSKAFTGYLYIGIRCAYNLCMNKNTTTTKPDNYAKYREQGFTQAQAFKMNTQDVIDWGVSNGHLQSVWATPLTKNAGK